MSDAPLATILFVDDEQPIRDMLARHFEFLGYQTCKAQNGREALMILDREPIEVVVTDLLMPVMNGLELMRELRDNHTTIGFFAVTGHIELRHLLTAMRLGAQDCFYKPLQDLGEMESGVASAVERLRRWELKLAKLRLVERDQP
jgi:DNA-binding NtrC family response regulator